MTCTQNSQDLFNYLVVIGPPFVTSAIAVFVGIVAYQQWRTNQNKLRLDLYNRRFEVYSNTITFFQFLSALPSGERGEEFKKAHRDFIRSCRESQFLFSEKSKIFEILEKIHSDSFKIIGFKEIGSDLVKSGNPEIFSTMALDADTSLSNFDASIKKLEKAMSQYLRFHGKAA